MIRPNPGSSTGCHVLASVGARSSTFTGSLAVGAVPMARKPSCVAISLPIAVPSGIDASGKGVVEGDALELGTAVLPAGVGLGSGLDDSTATIGSFTRPLPIAAAAPTANATSNAAASRAQRADARR